ncbi:MAG: signal peptidase II [Pseudomonadota bacterium]
MTESTQNTVPLAKPAATASRWLWLSVVVIALDQLTKWLIVQRFELFDVLRVNSVLNITRVHNYGAAFSFLGDQDGWQRWLFVGLAVVVCVVILVWLRKLPAKGQTWLALALVLVLGGAIGNVIDRVHYQYVVDFIDVHWQDARFPTFNIADIAISIGAFMLIVDSFLSREAPQVDQPADVASKKASE